MMSFYKGTVEGYVEAAASKAPTPGGGSVAALAGTLGAALTNMVDGLTVEKKAFAELPEEIQKGFQGHNVRVEQLRADLAAIIDEDTTAFDKVMEAFKLPKDTDEQKAARTAAIQEGYKIALEVPLRCGEKCLEMLKLQGIFAEYGNINAITDVGVGVLLAYTGMEGALLNVLINLGSLKDEAFRAEIKAKVDKMMAEGKELKEKHLVKVYERLNG